MSISIDQCIYWRVGLRVWIKFLIKREIKNKWRSKRGGGGKREEGSAPFGAHAPNPRRREGGHRFWGEGGERKRGVK